MILSYDFDDIAKITSVYNDFPDQSFTIERKGPGFDIYSLNGKIRAPVIDTLALRYFVSGFEHVACEFFVENMEPALLDSLSNAVPFRVLEVTDTQGKLTKIEAHIRRANGLVDDEGNPLEWDNERLYARIDDKTWVVIQYYVFDALFREFDFFFPQGG